MLTSVNTIYFKSDWKIPFKQSSTSSKPFYSDNATTNVTMMRQGNKLRYSENKNLRLLEIPYAGDEYSMYVILPHKRLNIKKLAELVNLEEIEVLQASASEHQVILQLPKFKIQTKIEAKQNLSGMGVNSAFTPGLGGANFNKMINQKTDFAQIYISEIHHDTCIEVGEKGTEAATATATIHYAVRAAAASREVPELVKFYADHPFIFTIVHNPSETILFTGWVSDPASLDQN